MFKEIDQITQKTKEAEERLLVTLLHKPDQLDEALNVLIQKENETIKDLLPHYHEQFEELVDAIDAGTVLPDFSFDAKPAKDAKEVAKDLRLLYANRNTALALAKGLGLLTKGQITADKLLPMLAEDLEHVKASLVENDDDNDVPKRFSDTTEELIAEYNEWYNAAKEFKEYGTVGLPTKFPKLDDFLGGLQEGVHVLGAPPGIGKTTLLLNIARNVSTLGYPALYVSFEESANRLRHKCVAYANKMDLKTLFRAKKHNPKEYQEAVNKASEMLKNLFIEDGKQSTTVNKIKAWAQYCMKETGKKRCLIIIDYLQFWAKGVKGKGTQEFRTVVGSVIESVIDVLVKELHCPVLLISSQNRAGRHSNDTASFGESSDIEYGASSAMFLVDPIEKAKKRNSGKGKNPEKTEEEIENEEIQKELPIGSKLLILYIEKNRFGETGKIKLVFHRKKGTFEELETWKEKQGR